MKPFKLIYFVLTGCYLCYRSSAKCEDKKIISINGEIHKTTAILLFPLTLSRHSNSYDVKMLSREIAYRNEFRQYINESGSNFEITTYDFCNDFSVMTKLILDNLLVCSAFYSHFWKFWLFEICWIIIYLPWCIVKVVHYRVRWLVEISKKCILWIGG